MAYEPRGKVKQIIDHMRTADADLEWSTEELAQAGNMLCGSISTQLKAAVKHEVLFRQKKGRRTVYSLTPFPQEPVEEVEPTPFDARRWLDGDIDLYGLLETDDGAMRVPAAKVPELMKLLGGVPA